MSEIGKLLEATKPFRDEIAKLHASVEHWKKQAGATDAAFLTKEKALEAAELQLSELQESIISRLKAWRTQYEGPPKPVIDLDAYARRCVDSAIQIVREINETRPPLIVEKGPDGWTRCKRCHSVNYPLANHECRDPNEKCAVTVVMEGRVNVPCGMPSPCELHDRH